MITATTDNNRPAQTLRCTCGGTYHMQGHVPGTDTEAQTMRVRWICDTCKDTVWRISR